MQELSKRQRPWADLPTQAKWTLGVFLASCGVVLVSGALAISARLLEWGGLTGG
jgi:hypothetical protein